jgi:hypothetical protein
MIRHVILSILLRLDSSRFKNEKKFGLSRAGFFNLGTLLQIISSINLETFRKRNNFVPHL